jgi:hypothetical protein
VLNDDGSSAPQTSDILLKQRGIEFSRRLGMDLPKNYDAYIVDLSQLVALAARVESAKTL